jgi:hypothetical protein
MPKKYLMNLRTARSLEGRVVESIERDKDKVIIKFTDGTAITIEPTHPGLTSGNNVYYITKEGDKTE